jgi:hypothetical protein
MESSNDIRPFFAQTKIKEDSDDYFIVSLSPREDISGFQSRLSPFVSISRDYNETSVVLKHVEWLSLREHLDEYKEDGPYRLITFDIVLDLSLIGYLSVVSGLLAENGISIYALSTFLRDHILVKKEDSGKAVKVLNELIDRCKHTN